MCGISGFLDASLSRSSHSLERIALRMAEAIDYRGPDVAGSWSDVTNGIAFAHRRLSIIDPSPTGKPTYDILLRSICHCL